LRFTRWQQMFFPHSRTRGYHAWSAAQPKDKSGYEERITDYYRRFMKEARENWALPRTHRKPENHYLTARS
jgi:hypothetical protein